MSKLLALILFILVGCGCGGSDGGEDPSLPPASFAQPKPPPAPCPYSEAQLQFPCSAFGQVCEFMNNGRHMRCVCTASGAQNCGTVF